VLQETRNLQILQPAAIDTNPAVVKNLPSLATLSKKTSGAAIPTNEVPTITGKNTSEVLVPVIVGSSFAVMAAPLIFADGMAMGGKIFTAFLNHSYITPLFNYQEHRLYHPLPNLWQ
jgi:hypothetical protein